MNLFVSYLIMETTGTKEAIAGAVLGQKLLHSVRQMNAEQAAVVHLPIVDERQIKSRAKKVRSSSVLLSPRWHIRLDRTHPPTRKIF